MCQRTNESILKNIANEDGVNNGLCECRRRPVDQGGNEWISGMMCQRTNEKYIDEYGPNGPDEEKGHWIKVVANEDVRI